MDDTTPCSALEGTTEVPVSLASDERLVSAIQACFNDLIERNEAHTEKVLEALKPKEAPTMDKESTFWNAYKTLADEYDKEFHKKYGTDLDTSLIFAGLFSAVSSAFIIQIQPELQQNPDAVIQTLLRVFIHNFNSTLLSGTDIAETNGGTPTIVVLVQSLLYASLFSTLLAALLAVLGKQWLLHYDAAGSRGTLEERGLERQSKYDGLQKWHFTTVMEMFPLLLQLALLFFWAALSIYLSTIHRTIAMVVTSLTSLGAVSYLSLLLSAVIYPDSPFQTPLAGVLRIWSEKLRQIVPISRVVSRLWHTNVQSQLRPWLRRTGASMQELLHRHFRPLSLPLFIHRKSSCDDYDPPDSKGIFDDEPFPKASPAVPAILWLLETSTNPDLISIAAGMAADLQWPLGLQLDLALHRLRDTFRACFTHIGWLNTQVRDGAVQCAINCGRAYTTIEMSSGGHHSPLMDSNDDFPEPQPEEPIQLSELRSVFKILQGSTPFVANLNTQCGVGWVLRVLPHTLRDSSPLDRVLAILLEQFRPDTVAGFSKQNYADYLLCMNILLGFKPLRRDLARKDKSQNVRLLIEELFNNLMKSLDRNSLNLVTAKKIITSMNQAAATALSSHNKEDVFDICSQLPRIPGWVDVAVFALSYVGPPTFDFPRLHDVTWVYAALEDIHQSSHMKDGKWDAVTSEVVFCLLEALQDATNFPKPPHRALRLILNALSAEGRISNLAVELLCRAETGSWFENSDLWPIMQEYSVWSRMGVVAMKDPQEPYINMGAKLSTLPHWVPYIQRDLSHWITVFSQCSDWSQPSLREPYISVLERIWGIKYDGPYQFMDKAEKTLALTLVALSNVWEGFEFSSGQRTAQEFYQLAWSTTITAFKARYESETSFSRRESRGTKITISPKFRAVFSASLGNALTQAAGNSRNALTGSPTQTDGDNDPVFGQERMEFLEGAAIILTEMAQVLKREPGNSQEECGEDDDEEYWERLKAKFVVKINALEESFKSANVEGGGGIICRERNGRLGRECWKRG